MSKYYVVSKLGMTPFASCETIRDARKDSALAKRLGLLGTIIRRDGRIMDRDQHEGLAPGRSSSFRSRA
jgi:hypothetical protein